MAHELSDRHGWSARRYAAQLAAEALEEGGNEESEFWKAVTLSLTPRGDKSRK